MPVKPEIAEFQHDMTIWRRDIHAHPETAFEEFRTADVVSSKLADFGVEVHRGLATTGVVGTLRVGSSNRAIGLRADMDALDIHEENAFDHVSTVPGKMHACSAPPATWRQRGASTAPCTSSSSRRRRTWLVDG